MLFLKQEKERRKRDAGASFHVIVKNQKKIKVENILFGTEKTSFGPASPEHCAHSLCEVLSLSLGRRSPKYSEEGRCRLFALNLVNFNLFFATCYQQHLHDGLRTTEEAFRGGKL